MELVQAGKEKRGSGVGNSTFSRYFNASGMGKFPDRGPTATAPLRSFCRDARRLKDHSTFNSFTVGKSRNFALISDFSTSAMPQPGRSLSS